jgi:hypothetical protein
MRVLLASAILLALTGCYVAPGPGYYGGGYGRYYGGGYGWHHHHGYYNGW